MLKPINATDCAASTKARDRQLLWSRSPQDTLVTESSDPSRICKWLRYPITGGDSASHELGDCYTGVVTENAPELAHIHDRSPIILLPDKWEAWLTVPLDELYRLPPIRSRAMSSKCTNAATMVVLSYTRRPRSWSIWRRNAVKAWPNGAQRSNFSCSRLDRNRES